MTGTHSSCNRCGFSHHLLISVLGGMVVALCGVRATSARLTTHLLHAVAPITITSHSCAHDADVPCVTVKVALKQHVGGIHIVTAAKSACCLVRCPSPLPLRMHCRIAASPFALNARVYPHAMYEDDDTVHVKRSRAVRASGGMGTLDE